MSTAQADWDDIMSAKAKPTTSLEQSPNDEEGQHKNREDPFGGKSYTLTVHAGAPEIQHNLAETVISIGKTLLDKNRKYGNSALDPLRVHSQATTIEQLKVRADDKLSRLRSAQADDAEDALLDYIGYMILLYVVEQKSK